MEVTATLDEMAFVFANIHLFSGVLQRFLASFSPPNSFLTFRMKTLQHPEEVLAWPPRAGERASI
jgi:type VI protein secretion system component VasA